MKYFRFFGIVLVGLFTALFLYPFLHEGGHILATIFIGEKVYEFQLLPYPFVISSLSNENLSETIVIVGLSGSLFPLLFSFAIYLKNFWLWLVGIYLNFICLISFVISIYSCIMFINGISIVNEDITKILEIFPEKATLYLVLFIFLSLLVIVQMIITNPIQHCR